MPSYVYLCCQGNLIGVTVITV
uniref:Uncharacterized protein n=1 Tax=Anguilla anguilla TaxID=7936 RepID=A0A0E9QB94_ANGAN